MYLGRYYIEKEKWIPAINRYKTILENYDDTIYVEAIHRLVEIHYKVGLINESKKYANLLGYNYQSGEWYEKSYIKFLIKIMKNQKLKTAKNKKTIIQRLRSLIN